ncbi:hypothetical protein BH24ACI4_BH24ACI4_27550 [soil metagenome]
MNESIDNLVAYQPSPDALAQISVETNNYSADSGNVAGAVISNVIKSGSNAFRGNVFEFYRDSRMWGFTGFPFSDFLLDQVATKGRGSLSEPWTHLHNRMALFVQDDFKLTPELTLNLGMRWAYT